MFISEVVYDLAQIVRVLGKKFFERVFCPRGTCFWLD
jgi:hypothetical protein